MEKILSIYKPVGLTPLQAIQKLREKYPEYRDVKIGFAGRLDPLAHGVMLLTVGEENKNRQEYLSLDKTYKFSVLFGVSTDSYDYLGLPNYMQINKTSDNLEEKIREFIKQNTGIFTQTYPPFSSKTVNGIQLYKLAKTGKLDKNNLPTRQVEIYKFNYLSIEEIMPTKIKKEIVKNLKRIKGHFRQTKTIKFWQELFENNPIQNMKLAHFDIDCSSGTYIRSLAQRMGEEFKCGAIAYEIYRTKVGKYSIEKTLKLD